MKRFVQHNFAGNIGDGAVKMNHKAPRGVEISFLGLCLRSKSYWVVIIIGTEGRGALTPCCRFAEEFGIVHTMGEDNYKNGGEFWRISLCISSYLRAFRNHSSDEILQKPTMGEVSHSGVGNWYLITPGLVIDDLPVDSSQFPCLVHGSRQTLQLGCGQCTGRCLTSVGSVFICL